MTQVADAHHHFGHREVEHAPVEGLELAEVAQEEVEAFQGEADAVEGFGGGAGDFFVVAVGDGEGGDGAAEVGCDSGEDGVLEWEVAVQDPAVPAKMGDVFMAEEEVLEGSGGEPHIGCSIVEVCPAGPDSQA